MERKIRYELLIDLIIGCLIFGIIVNFASNSLEPKVKDYLIRNYPKVPYFAFIILFATIVITTYILIKNEISRRVQILNFELKNPEKNDSRGYIVNAIKNGSLKGESLAAFFDSTKPSEIQPFIKLIRLKIGKRKSFALGEHLYQLGKYYQNITHELVTAREYFELATELYPEDPVYPNEAAVISSTLTEYTRARHFFLASMTLYARKRKWRKGLATTQNNIGICCLRLGQFDEALDYFHRSRTTHLRVTKNYTVDFIHNEINIASVYWQTNHFREALQILSNANSNLKNVVLSQNVESLGKEQILLKMVTSHIPRQMSEIQIDMYLKSKDNQILKEALDSATTALSIDMNHWGEHEEPTALSYNMLGKVFDELNEKHGALKVYKKACSFFSKIKFKDHKPLVHCKRRIEELEKEIGDLEI